MVVKSTNLAGYVLVDIDIAPNEKLQKPSEQTSATSGSNMEIPDWIKNTAKWWADDIIHDGDFINGIQYMIQNQIIKIPSTVQKEGNPDQTIPSWVKDNAKWWADGTISDYDFVKGLQYLVEHGIIRV